MIKISKRKQRRKGYYYSVDALIALVIIIFILFIIKPLNKPKPLEASMYGDMMEVLSSLKVGEADNTYVQQLITQGKINNTNLSLLDQIGEFYAKDMPEARTLAENLLNQISPNENVGIWFGNELIASHNTTPIEEAEQIWTTRQIVSGIAKGGVRGYSARAYLTRSSRVKYFYFGGYVGDGNISILINYSGDIEDMSFEIAINREFDLYINNHYSGHYEKSPDEFTPAKYDPAYENYFNSGENLIEFKASSPIYIAGGYIKIRYKTDNPYKEPSIYNFPGVDGLINIYDGFHVPSEISNMEVYLHYLSNNNTVFLTIGNTTILNETKETEQQKLITDSELKALLNYSKLSNKTVPIRFGLSGIEGAVGGGGGVADIVFLIDSTGSMWDEIQDVYEIVEDFTKVLENKSIDYRLGLIEFKDYPESPCGGSSDFPYKIHTFDGDNWTNNASEFRKEVNLISASGGYDLPESHLRAINESLILNWRTDAKKYEIMLTDAPPHAIDCDWNFGWWQCLPWPGCCDGNSNCPCNYPHNLGPANITEVTNSLVRNNITFYYINKEDQGLCDNRIMADNMTNLTGGKFYSYTESEGVQDIIVEIAGEIANLTFKNQTAIVEGELTTKLYPDSYIKFNYTQPEYYGLIITGESENFESSSNSSQGTFYVPEDSQLIEAFAVSYSGPKWTKTVSIGNNLAYNLTEYGTNYISLGDPYFIYLPKSFVGSGENSVEVNVGRSSQETLAGSTSNKIIYTLLKNITGFSSIKSIAVGCNWTITLENGENLTVNIPTGYTGTKKCYFTPGPISYDENDAVDLATYNLLTELDFNNNNKIDLSIEKQDLEIESSKISGIPYTWSTEVQVRVWR